MNAPQPRFITGFEAVGRRGARIKIFINDIEWTELDAETIVRERLARGEEVNAQRCAAILHTDECIRARKAAAGYNARQPRSRREVERYLRDKYFSGVAIDTA